MNKNPSAAPYLWVAAAFGCLLAGGPPAGAALEITNVSRSTGALTFSWPNLGTGLVYSVQCRDWLDHGIWLTASGQRPWPVPEPAWTEAPGAAGPMRFYRVAAVPAAERGKLISYAPPLVFSQGQLVLLYLGGMLPVYPQYGVRLYKVVYETIDPLGGRTVASGALALPDSQARAWPLASYQHGTITKTNAAPSAMQLDSELGVGVAFATTGYAAALPDYLGLGDSPGLHPYHHARSEATASVDMLRAARQVCASQSYTLNGQIFLCGYSQGGHATMALQRELELYHTNEFTLTASAPAAGAYDLSGATAAEFLSDHPTPNPYYLAYLLAAYQEVYQFTGSLTNWLAPAYQSTLPPLLKGNASGSQINAVMPPIAVEILKPEVLAQFRSDPFHPLRLALRDNDVFEWTPRAPTRLYHCAADQDVPFANSQVAHAYFQSHDAVQVQLIDPLPTGDHGDCVLPSLLLVKAWFDSLKE